jgi:hypothetical protein
MFWVVYICTYVGIFMLDDSTYIHVYFFQQFVININGTKKCECYVELISTFTKKSGVSNGTNDIDTFTHTCLILGLLDCHWHNCHVSSTLSLWWLTRESFGIFFYLTRESFGIFFFSFDLSRPLFDSDVPSRSTSSPAWSRSYKTVSAEIYI